MIRFSLGCDKGHEFEGWFASNDEFSRLKSAGHLDCPSCGSHKIEKLLMSPAIPKKANAKTGIAAVAGAMSVADVAPEPANVPAGVPSQEGLAQQKLAMPDLPPQLAEMQAEMVEKIREFKKHVIANSEDVGDKFVEEARKIHFGEAEKRGIYGKADVEEALELLEEGIEVVPVPELPEDRN